jgi:hypothetical protein
VNSVWPEVLNTPTARGTMSHQPTNESAIAFYQS